MGSAFHSFQGFFVVCPNIGMFFRVNDLHIAGPMQAKGPDIAKLAVKDFAALASLSSDSVFGGHVKVSLD
jgi:hypothetical protein